MFVNSATKFSVSRYAREFIRQLWNQQLWRNALLSGVCQVLKYASIGREQEADAYKYSWTSEKDVSESFVMICLSLCNTYRQWSCVSAFVWLRCGCEQKRRGRTQPARLRSMYSCQATEHAEHVVLFHCQSSISYADWSVFKCCS
jgi:hypothetical protein